MIDWTNPKALRLKIVDAGLSVERFAELCGVSRTQMFRLCAGVNKPHWDTQRKIEVTFARLNVPEQTRKGALNRAAPQSTKGYKPQGEAA